MMEFLDLLLGLPLRFFYLSDGGFWQWDSSRGVRLAGLVKKGASA